MKSYDTAPRRELLARLAAQPERMFSAAELARELSGLSQSTVYRLLGRLTGEGRVLRLAGEAGRGFLYQYAGHSVGSGHLHLRCTRCGRIVCMDQGDSQDVMSRVFAKNGFAPDGENTLLPGLCAGCGQAARCGGPDGAGAKKIAAHRGKGEKA